MKGHDAIAPDERHRLLVEWNDTDQDVGYEGSVHELFEQRVIEAPDATALVFRDADITYRALNERANRLARTLRRVGVGPDVVVALALKASIDFVVGVVAILKAGGAYLPLDPDGPHERAEAILEQAGVRHIVTRRSLGSRVGEAGHDIRRVLIDAHREDIDREASEDPPWTGSPGDLAYVIFTSGSTGPPKGVMIPHRAIRNRVLTGRQAYKLTSRDRTVLVVSTNFDSAAAEIFESLSAGAGLVVVDEAEMSDPSSVVRLIRGHGVTVIGCVPSWLDAMLEDPDFAECSSVRLVSVGGEELRRGVVERFFRAFPAAQLLNEYGPTETTVDVISFRCEPHGSTERVPIGRPHPNVRVYILGEERELVPIGEIGELYVAGVAVARGYLNDAALTADRFLPEGFRSSAERMYRTGDLARYRPDGTIEYVGRADDQVKIRGFRVEPGEVEAAIAALPGVREVAVEGLRGGDGVELVAYVAADATVGSVHQLGGELRSSLPGYMIPTRWTRLDALPRTPIGKIDRALLKESARRHGSQGDAREASTPAGARRSGARNEMLVGGVWREVLGFEVDPDLNFFEAGGDSVKAMKVVAMLGRRGAHLSLESFFDRPTVAGQAGILDG